jgi:hypothetical protein
LIHQTAHRRPGPRKFSIKFLDQQQAIATAVVDNPNLTTQNTAEGRFGVDRIEGGWVKLKHRGGVGRVSVGGD